MGDLSTLKAAVAAAIRTNGNQEITGQVLQNTLTSIINTLGTGAQYMGIATPSTNPGTPDAKVFYIASANGTYSNFGGITVNNEVAFLVNSSGSWLKQSTGFATIEVINNIIGSLANLQTQTKNNLVDAINELLSNITQLDQNLKKNTSLGYEAFAVNKKTGYIKTDVNIGDNIQSNINNPGSYSSNIYTIIENADKLNEVKIYALGGAAGRLYCIVDKSGVVLDVAESGVDASITPVEVMIPDNADKIIVNSNKILSDIIVFAKTKSNIETQLLKEENVGYNEYFVKIINGKYIKTDVYIGENIQSNINNPLSAGNAYCIVSDINKYNSVRIKGFGGAAGRLYCIVDKSGVVLDVAKSGVDASQNLVEVVIPSDADRLIINTNPNYSNIALYVSTSLREDVNDIKDAMYGYHELPIDQKYGYVLNNVSIGVDISNNIANPNLTSKSNVYAIVSGINKFKKIKVNGFGGTGSRLWCFVDKNGIVIDIAQAAVNAVNTAVEINVPENADKLILGSNPNYSAIKLQVYGDAPTILFNSKEYNNDGQELLYALKTSYSSANAGRGHNQFAIAHISDLHCDNVNYEIFKEYVSKNGNLINTAIATGDFGILPKDEEYAYLKDNDGIVKVTGNHEFGEGGYTFIGTPEDVYRRLKLNTNTGKLYYSIDYPNNYVKLICLNQYDVVSTNVEVLRAQMHYSQAQIDWFVTELEDAIEKGYHVLVAMHAPEGFITPNDKGFCQDYPDVWNHIKHNRVCSGTPIEDIIDAFKNGYAINKNYTYSDVNMPISVSHSFVSAGTFVAYLCGHFHGDYCGHSDVEGHGDQLYLLVTTGAVHVNEFLKANYGEQVSDLPRVPGTDTAYAFNIYGVDVPNKIIKVLRIGSNVTNLMTHRDICSFKY